MAKKSYNEILNSIEESANMDEEQKVESLSGDTSEPDDETAIALQKAAELLGKAATDRTNRSGILKEVESALGKIKLVDFPDLAESPVIQGFLRAMGVDDLKPGEVKNKGTLAEREREWTWRDLVRFPPKTFIPAESIQLTFNGLTIQVEANEEITIPSCFYDIYREHQEALKQGRIHEQWLMGRTDQQPHPNWMTPEGAVVRAWSKQGERLGLVSGFLGTGPIDVTPIPPTEEK